MLLAPTYIPFTTPMVVSSAAIIVYVLATSTLALNTESVVRYLSLYVRLSDADQSSGCDNVINRNNTLTAGQLSPDLACQSACRGNPSEACGTVDTFMSIYEYTVSGFLKTACVPVCLCFALFGRSVEQPSARWRDMFREEPVEELGLGEHGLGEGGCWRGPYVGIPGPHAFHPYPCLYPQRDQYISDASIRCPH